MPAEHAIERLGRLMDESLPTDDEEVNLEHTNITMAGITGSPVTSEMWTETDDIQDKSTIYSSFFDIALWSQKVVESGPEPLPLTRTSFERGVIASMSTNDILMIKGLISPAVYIEFFNLASFS